MHWVIGVILLDMKTFVIVAIAALGGALLVMMYVGNEPTVEIEVDETMVTTETVTEVPILPSDLPTNVPMYPGSVLARVTDSTTEGERNVSLTLNTGDSVPDVITWYRGALSADGWAVTDDRNVGGYTLLKGQNENVTVFMQSASGEEGQTVITQRVRTRGE